MKILTLVPKGEVVKFTYVLPMANPNFFALTWALIEYWNGLNTRDHCRGLGAYINIGVKSGHSFEMGRM